jgi:PAS domain-containing protein/DNA-binding CsgD family transcriptional regulator
MSTHERTLAVIQKFYEASMDEALWPSALKDLADLTESQAASFWVLDGSDKPRLPTFICINFDMERIKEYLEHTAAIDPTNHYLVAHPRQAIVHDGLVITEQEKNKHPYYDWHDRNIDTRFRMVGQTCLTQNVQAGVALHRTRKAGRFEPRDIDQFAVLHGHLERALAIAFRIGSLGATKQLATEWLDRSPVAVIFLDERKHIVFANRAAEALKSCNDGVTLGAGGITLSHRHDDERLQYMIAQALSPIASSNGFHDGAMRATRPSGKRPYGILVGSVSRDYPVLSTIRPAICVVITDPDSEASLSSQRIQSAFGFTNAEARLAVLLTAGEDLRSAAHKLKITYGTARTRLAEIFLKTETRRQGELIRLLLKTLATD